MEGRLRLRPIKRVFLHVSLDLHVHNYIIFLVCPSFPSIYIRAGLGSLILPQFFFLSFLE